VIPVFFCFCTLNVFHCPIIFIRHVRVRGNDGLSGIGFSILLSWLAVLIQSLNRAESVFNATILKINCGKRFAAVHDDDELVHGSISSVY
jgi:hypothetical protein